MKFHEKLYEIRKKAGMTQDNLAERLNVSRQAVSRWEMGTAMPDVENLVAISDLFGVSLDYLLKDGPLPEKQEEEAVPPQTNAPAEKKEQKGSWMLIPIVLPLMGLSMLFYGWVFEKDVLCNIGFLLLGISLAVLVIGLLGALLLVCIKKLKSKK